MRHETQPYDQVRATLEVVSAGQGQAGLSPTVAIRRISDGLWLQSGGGSWGAGFSTNSMSELDATNLPGFYQYAIPDAQLSEVDGAAGYVMRIAETDTGLLETVFVHSISSGGSGLTASAVADAVWDETLNSHVSAGTTGRALAVIQGLVHGNHRIRSPVYDINGRLLTCELVVYPTSTDALNETNAIATLNVTSTYDGFGNLATFLSRE